MNKYGICTSSSSKYTILDEIGDHFLDHAVELVKEGKKFVLVCDNIDWEERVPDMRSDYQTRAFMLLLQHWFLTMSRTTTFLIMGHNEY